jgi:uncharacterized protein (TIGR03066 family)
MIVRGVVAVAVLFACCAWVGADEPKPTDLKKAVVGKWEAIDKDKMPLEIFADGTIKVSVYAGDGKWEQAEGTYTISDAGELRYRASKGGATLGGWYRYKDGVLTSAKGPKLVVTWKKVEEKK